MSQTIEEHYSKIGIRKTKEYIGAVYTKGNIKVPIIRSPIDLIGWERYRFVIVEHKVMRDIDELYYCDIYIRDEDDAKKILSCSTHYFRDEGKEKDCIVLYSPGGGGYVFQVILSILGLIDNKEVAGTW